MELQEDVFDKVRIIQDAIKTEEELLPQGETVPKDVLFRQLCTPQTSSGCYHMLYS